MCYNYLQNICCLIDLSERIIIMHLSEKTIKSETIYEGKIITVKKDEAELENGATALRELVVHNGGVCVVPVNDKGEVLLVKQFRYPFKEVLIEVPAGKLEDAEEHREAGLRELREETGAVCSDFEYMGVMYPSVAYLSEKIHMYLATGLSFEEQELDIDEFLDVFAVKLDDAVDMVMRNEIKDGKTQTALLMAYNMLKKNTDR